MSRKTYRNVKLVIGLALCLVNAGLCLTGNWMVGAPIQCLATCLVLNLI